MPDISNQIDKLSQQIADKVSLAQEEVATALMQLTKGKTTEEAAIILADVNIQDLMKLKLAGVFATFDSGAITMLENTFTTVGLSEAALQAALSNAKSFVSEKFVEGTASSIRQNIISGITGNKTPSQVIADLRKSGFDTHHLKTQVETGFAQYSNAVKNMMADKLPIKTKFVYIGANDDRTRDECLDRISISPATKEEIITQFGSLDNAGWNCRHTWEEQMPDVAAQGLQKEQINA